jgi:hypothetical protein
MFKKIYTLLLIFSILTDAKSQYIIHKDSLNKTNNTKWQIVKASVVDGDTIVYVDLKAITIVPPIALTSQSQVKRYTKLIAYVKKVYPYSQIVKEQIAEINTHLEEYKTQKEKKAYIDRKEKELKQQFEGQLRELTYSQGKILIKLINRETGFTTYEIVKELKGSLNAFFWQSIARLFGSNLKLEYDANGDDKMIEDIVVKIENGEI